MIQKRFYSILFFGLLGLWLRCQDMAYNDYTEPSYETAHNLAYKGDHKSAEVMLIQLLSKNPDNLKAHSLLASTYSWGGQYDKARNEFNKITSTDRNNSDVWVSA
ncbi:MAG: tetratricopeptide repeat protein, partial [Flavobacteriaceae bacterium]